MAYTHAIMPIIGPYKDIPAPDVNTNEQTMAWILEAARQAAGQPVPAIVTGKPLALGGSLGRPEATGRGVAMVTALALEKQRRPLTETTVAIQGFGKVGAQTARLLRGMGCRIVAVSDVSGGLYDPDGLFVEDLLRYVAHSPGHLLAGYRGSGEPISNEDLLRLDVDVLIPAAMEDQITAANADQIRARLIVEAANGPTTPAAHQILVDQRRARGARHPGERRRGGRLLLRVAAKPPGLLLGSGDGEPPPGAEDGRELRRGLALQRSARRGSPHRRVHARGQPRRRRAASPQLRRLGPPGGPRRP